jgi:hypothetical protein
VSSHGLASLVPPHAKTRDGTSASIRYTSKSGATHCSYIVPRTLQVKLGLGHPGERGRRQGKERDARGEEERERNEKGEGKGKRKRREWSKHL